jgi:CcmD family protein
MTGVLAAAPALPLHTAGPYVAAAYIVFVALILIYVAIMARKLTRTHRELRELKRDLEVKEELEPTVQETPRPSERAQERIA